MNVFGSTQTSVTNTFLTNIEQDVKSFSNTLNKFEHLLEEHHNSVKLLEEQIATLQSLLIEYMFKIDTSLQHIIENTDKLKKNP